jgi:hypothetical protein
LRRCPEVADDVCPQRVDLRYEVSIPCWLERASRAQTIEFERQHDQIVQVLIG